MILKLKKAKNHAIHEQQFLDMKRFKIAKEIIELLSRVSNEGCSTTYH